MQIQDALQLTLDEMYEHIGRDISIGIELGEVEPEEYKSRGKRWISKYRSKLREIICNGQVAKVTLSDNRTWDQVLLVAAVADLISSVSTGVSPVVVAALLVKEGLSQLCTDSQKITQDV